MAIVSASLPVMKPCVLWVGKKLGLRPPSLPSIRGNSQQKRNLSANSSESSTNTICTAQQLLDEESLYRVWVGEAGTSPTSRQTTTDQVENLNIVIELESNKTNESFSRCH